jgi:hypothetical protein
MRAVPRGLGAAVKITPRNLLSGTIVDIALGVHNYA